MRTISSLESFHSALNRSITHKKHFFKFIECLRLHESRKADQLFALIHGIPATRFQRNARNQQREEKIKRLTNLLLKETYSVKQFLKAMADDGNCTYDFLIVQCTCYTLPPMPASCIFPILYTRLSTTSIICSIERYKIEKNRTSLLSFFFY